MATFMQISMLILVDYLKFKKFNEIVSFSWNYYHISYLQLLSTHNKTDLFHFWHKFRFIQLFISSMLPITRAHHYWRIRYFAFILRIDSEFPLTAFSISLTFSWVLNVRFFSGNGKLELSKLRQKLRSSLERSGCLKHLKIWPLAIQWAMERLRILWTKKAQSIWLNFLAINDLPFIISSVQTGQQAARKHHDEHEMMALQKLCV